MTAHVPVLEVLPSKVVVDRFMILDVGIHYSWSGGAKLAPMFRLDAASGPAALIAPVPFLIEDQLTQSGMHRNGRYFF